MAGRAEKAAPKSVKKKAKKKAPKKYITGPEHGNSKQTEAARNIIISSLREALPFSYSCDYAGIDRQTGYRWMESDKEFAAQVAIAKAYAISSLVADTRRQSGAWKLLKNIGREEFKEHVEIKQESELTLILDTGDGEEQFSL